MSSKNSISCSENAMVIRLDQVQLEEIVEEKLSYYLDSKNFHFVKQDLLKKFYKPVEQALIHTVLERCKGNQLKTSQLLGINRNTLKKKIVDYELDMKNYLKKKGFESPSSHIFLSSLADLDLLKVCQAKLLFDQSKNQLPTEKIIKHIAKPIEKKIIQIVLEYCKGNQLRASQLLGINRNTLKKKTSEVKGIRICL